MLKGMVDSFELARNESDARERGEYYLPPTIGNCARIVGAGKREDCSKRRAPATPAQPKIAASKVFALSASVTQRERSSWEILVFAASSRLRSAPLDSLGNQTARTRAAAILAT